MAEHMVCNHGVRGSNPLTSTNEIVKLAQAIPVLIMILPFGAQLRGLPMLVRFAVVSLMMGLVVVAVLLKRKEERGGLG